MGWADKMSKYIVGWTGQDETGRGRTGQDVEGRFEAADRKHFDVTELYYSAMNYSGSGGGARDDTYYICYSGETAPKLHCLYDGTRPCIYIYAFSTRRHAKSFLERRGGPVVFILFTGLGGLAVPMVLLVVLLWIRWF